MTILNGRRFPLIFVVLLFSVLPPPQLFSQVIIKERVEIHPKSAPLVRMQTASSLQIVARWSVSGELNPTIEPSIGMANQFCQSYGTGDLVKTAPAVSGGYKILASVSTLGAVAYELVVEVGGTQVLQQSGVTQPNVRLFLFPEVVLHSGVAFYAYQQEISHGGSTGIGLGAPTQHPLALCSGTIWHQKMPTSFTITAGAALGSFYDLSGTSLGTTVEWTEETIASIRYVADGEPPPNGGQDVIIQASNVTGVLGETTIRVLGSPSVIDHFEILAMSDTLAHGTSTPLRVITKDADSLEIQDFGADQSVVLTLIGGGIQAMAAGAAGEGSGLEASASASYGSFVITPNYFDTVFVIPDQVTIPLQMLQMGEVTVAFLANGDFPPGTDPGVLTIRAEAEWNPSIKGEGRVVVVRESGCEAAPECPPTSFVPPLITLQVQSNGFGGIDVCKKPSTGGAFAPAVGKDLLQPFTVDACFDRTFGKWRFQVPTITFNVIQDLCYQNIYSNGQELVNSVSDISASDCERAKRDFRLHANYPIADPNDQNYKVKFLITQALLFHEELHKLDLQNIINSYQQEWTNKFSSFQPSCDEVRSLEDARAKGQFQISNTLDEHWRKILSVSRERTGDQEEIDKGNLVEIEKRRKNEEKIQNSPLVQMFVRDFVASVNCQ